MPLDVLDQLDQEDLLGLEDQVVSQVHLEKWEGLVLLDSKVHLENKVDLDLKDHKDQEDLRDLRWVIEARQ